MTLEEIGEYMGITRERVRQIEAAALGKLRFNTGDEIAWIGKITIAIPECRKCGESYIRATGRQEMCASCEAARRPRRTAAA